MCEHKQPLTAYKWDEEMKISRSDDVKDVTIEAGDFTFTIRRYKQYTHKRTLGGLKCVCGHVFPEFVSKWTVVKCEQHDEIVAKNWTHRGVKLW